MSCCRWFKSSVLWSAVMTAATSTMLLAQTPKLLSDAATQLHQAWLHEVLDLDTDAAIRGYEAVAGDKRGNAPERWVAIARLSELQRDGLPVQQDFSTAEVPAKLRAALAAAPSAEPLRSLLRRFGQQPAELLQAISQQSQTVPELRPFTHVALDCLREQIDYGKLQWFQRMSQRNRASPPSNANERWNAADILHVELQQGQEKQAEALRAYYFANWHPPVWHDDPNSALTRVRNRLEAWFADGDTSPQQKALLRSLRETLDQRAAADPADALAFLARLPVYADRLLPEPPPEGQK